MSRESKSLEVQGYEFEVGDSFTVKEDNPTRYLTTPVNSGDTIKIVDINERLPSGVEIRYKVTPESSVWEGRDYPLSPTSLLEAIDDGVLSQDN